MGGVLDGHRRNASRGTQRTQRQCLRVVYLLSSADRDSMVLHRPRARRGRIVDLVSPDDRGDATVERSQPGAASAARNVRDRRQCRDVALDHRRCRRRALVPDDPRGVWLERDGRCRAVAHFVLMDSARDRLFLALPQLHRLLHNGAEGRRRPALLRHDGPPRLHIVHSLLAARRTPPPVHGPGAFERVQVHPDVPDRAGLGSDAAHCLHHHRFDGSRGTDARRDGHSGLDSSAALGPPHGARDRACFPDAFLRRRRRAHQHELRNERYGPQHELGHRAFPPW